MKNKIKKAIFSKSKIGKDIEEVDKLEAGFNLKRQMALLSTNLRIASLNGLNSVLQLWAEKGIFDCQD